MYSISGLLQIIEALVVRVLSGGDGGELVGRERSSEESRPPRSKLTYDRGILPHADLADTGL